MQIQNQQNMWTVQQPQQVATQYVNQTNWQQVPQQPIVQEDWIFDKILKWIVDFIARLAAPSPINNNNQQVIQNWQQISQQPQNMPWIDLFNKIWNTLDSIWNQAGQIVQNWTSSLIQWTQNYVAEQPVWQVNTQQLLTQAYQPNNQNQPVAPVVQQPVAPVVQQPVAPVVQQPVAPVVQQPVAPVVQQPVTPVVQSN